MTSTPAMDSMESVRRDRGKHRCFASADSGTQKQDRPEAKKRGGERHHGISKIKCCARPFGPIFGTLIPIFFCEGAKSSQKGRPTAAKKRFTMELAAFILLEDPRFLNVGGGLVW